MTFGGRLLLAMVSILVVTVLGTMVAADRWMRAGFEDAMRRDLEREARVVAAALGRDTSEFRAAARRLGGMLGRRVTVIDSGGRVVGDSDFDDASLSLLDDHSTRPEVVEARQRGVGHSRRFSTSTDRVEIKTAVRAWPGYVRVSAPVDQADAVMVGTKRAVFVAALAALGLGVLLAWAGGRQVGRPLDQLTAAAGDLAAGRTPAYPTSHVPEVRQLVRAFRSMQEQLADRIAAVQRRRAETAAIVESMVEGVLAVDAGGAVVFGNSAVRRMLGFGPDQTLPDLRELFRTPDTRHIVEVVLGGEAVLGREAVLDDRSVLVTARPLPTAGAVICLHDITELRRLEAIRRDFVANVSHELKTPLTSIAGYADTLAAEAPDPDTAARFLDVIRANAHRMQRLVDDLLDLARLDAGAWQPNAQLLDVRTVVDAAWTPLAARAADATIVLETAIDPEIPLFGDEEALRQILTNLLDNAIRHTPAGGRIRISHAGGDRGTILTVADTGAGIPAEHLPRVFERFYRIDPARSRAQGGTGLGLAIVKHLVEGHGGHVDVSSTVGLGTTVQLVFPAPPP